jgi:hypothetical protein
MLLGVIDDRSYLSAWAQRLAVAGLAVRTIPVVSTVFDVPWALDQWLRWTFRRRLVGGLGAVVSDELCRTAIGEPAILMSTVRVAVPTLRAHSSSVAKLQEPPRNRETSRRGST